MTNIDRLKSRLILPAIVFLQASCFSQEASPERYNVVWDTQSLDASESMPVGGGDIGLNVWVEDGDVLFYMQRSGSLAETNEYLKLGRVRLKLEPNPFAGEHRFHQKLNLPDGSVLIRSTRDHAGSKLTTEVRIWVEVERPIIHVDIKANHDSKVRAAYENWRLEDKLIPNNRRQRSFFSLDRYPGEVRMRADQVQHLAGGVLFYHRNPAETVVDLLIEQQGMAGARDQIANDLKHRTFGGFLTGTGFVPTDTSEGRYQALDYRAWNLETPVAARSHQLRVVTHIAQTDTVEAWEQTLQEQVLASSNDQDRARAQARDWWQDFWQRSFIHIHPEDPDPQNRAWRVGRNYQLFRYQLGCNARGEYPTKFNGGNFTYDANLVGGRGSGFGPDWRDWGGGIFTAQNQRLVYWPMLKAGDFDAIHSQFELYRKALPGAQARVREHFGHAGAVYSEYIGVPGLAAGFGWGWESGGRARGEEIPFGDPRADGTHAYNSLVEAGVMANGAISYHYESQLEHAYMMLEYHRFTGGDITRYMPFIENAVVFFDEHYRKREKMRSGRELDANGDLVIFPSKACETFRGATNPTDLIAALHACIEGILRLDDDSLKLRDKAYYRRLQQSIPPYTYAESNGDRVIQPAAAWKIYKNAEIPQLYPLFPFNRFDLLGADLDSLEVFRDTYTHGTFRKGNIVSWHQDGIFFARMGLTAEAADFNARKLDDSSRRFPTFWGPGHDWVPDHNWGGSGMIGLQEMLMQTIGDEIRLFPAWPADWDVDFRLRAPHQTRIEGRLRNGQLVDLNVTPKHRYNDVKTAIGTLPPPLEGWDY